MKKLAIHFGLIFLCQISKAQEASNQLDRSKERFPKKELKDLRNKIEDRELKDITSLIVLKEGKILVEEYFNGVNRESLHDTRSLTKSFTSTILGIALNEGYLNSVDETLGQFYELKKFKNYSEDKSAVTLKDLLTMSSGFDGFDFDPNSPGNEEKMYPTTDWVKFTLDLPMKEFTEDELQWQYFTAGVVVLGDILNRTVPEGLEAYAQAKLFKPLGIAPVKWQYTPSGVPNTAGSCQLRAIDFAKYGQLYLNKGMWDGNQILPENWVRKTFESNFNLPDDLGYGYLFWTKDYSVSEKSFHAVAASGNGGNKVFIFPELDIVVVITSTAYNQSFAHKQADQIIEKYVIPNVIE